MAPELDIVEMRLLANTEHADELVLASVERALAGIRLHPDRQVQEVAIDRATGLEQLADMTPIHAYEMHGAIAGEAGFVSTVGLRDGGFLLSKAVCPGCL